VVCSLICHPEPAFFAQPEPALSEVEGDLGEPRDVPRSLRHHYRAFGSLPYQTTTKFPGMPAPNPGNLELRSSARNFEGIAGFPASSVSSVSSGFKLAWMIAGYNQCL